MFQMESVTYDHVALNPVLGNLNGSNSNAWLSSSYGGAFSFLAQEDCVLELTETLGTVRVNGEGYGTGSTIPVNSGSNYVFEWSYTMTPMLPFSLIIGVVGLGMVFGGPIYAIHSFRQGEYRTALITCTIITLVGVALVIGWFYS